jgi:hypothetical protein
MNSSRLILALCVLLLVFTLSAPGQTSPPFGIQAYEGFLAAHSNMNSNQLMSLHPAGRFAARSPVLFQNYPNPFNPGTLIRYALPSRSAVGNTTISAPHREDLPPLNCALQGGPKLLPPLLEEPYTV